jgi:pyridoxamine 5'-phosphate oxidase
VQDPLALFEDWFQEAGKNDSIANSVALATVSGVSQPAARMVLLKGFNSKGFTFYTYYSSRKAQELDRTPKAALCFYWRHLNRSVWVEGSVVRVAREESDEYFHSHPRGSQLGAWCSAQSSEVPSRQV